MGRIPEAVMVDTRDGHTWWRDSNDSPLTMGTAAALVERYNDGLPPERQTYRAYRLVEIHGAGGDISPAVSDVKTPASLTWETAGTDEPLDQNAGTVLMEHGYWSLGPNGDGSWSLALVVQNASLDVLTEISYGPLPSQEAAKAVAAEVEASGDLHHEPGRVR